MNVETDMKIADINDKFRRTSTNFMITKGVMHLGNTDAVIDLVRRFDSFNESNDPYGEHDFGAFKFEGETLFWKIDYYDKDIKHGTDSLDPLRTLVLTVMLSSEY